jgi:hypothetical protein
MKRNKTSENCGTLAGSNLPTYNGSSREGTRKKYEEYLHE